MLFFHLRRRHQTSQNSPKLSKNSIKLPIHKQNHMTPSTPATLQPPCVSPLFLKPFFLCIRFCGPHQSIKCKKGSISSFNKYYGQLTFFKGGRLGYLIHRLTPPYARDSIKCIVFVYATCARDLFRPYPAQGTL
jgi:hypothetical protein